MMTVTLFKTHPNLPRFAFAPFLVGAAYLLNLWDVGPASDPESLTGRLFLLAALVFLSHDAMAGAKIGSKGSRDWRNPHVLMSAFYPGLFWALAMILMLWPAAPSVSQSILTWSVAGVFFGLFMVLTPMDDRATDHLLDQYDLSDPLTEKRFGRVAYFGWPFVILGFAGLAALFPADDPLTLMWVFVLFSGVCPLYQLVLRPLARTWQAHTARVLGIICIGLGQYHVM